LKLILSHNQGEDWVTKPGEKPFIHKEVLIKQGLRYLLCC
jgi:hypothetical protein